MRSKLVNESRLLISIRTWLVIKTEGNTSYWMGSGSFFLLSFYFKIKYNGEAGELHTQGRHETLLLVLRLSPCTASLLLSFTCPSNILVLPGLHKGPILLFLIFEMTYLFFNFIFLIEV